MLADVNMEVKLSILCQLGDIIINIGNIILVNDLATQFFKIPQMHLAYEENGEMLVSSFAKRFADILAIVSSWDAHRKGYFIIAYSEFSSVRLLACRSMSKVAKIIGKDSTAIDLCPLLEKFLSDDMAIKKACLKCICEFYISIPEKQQLQLLLYLRNYNVFSQFRKTQIIGG
jgi:hypothetical protein